MLDDERLPSLQKNIVSQAYVTKDDTRAADGPIRKYISFICSEAVKFLNAAPEYGHEDELGIAMLAYPRGK